MKSLKLIGRLMAYRPVLYTVNGLTWMLVHGAFIIPGLLTKAFFDALEGRAGAPRSTGFVLILIGAFAAARVLHIYVSALVDILHRFTMSALVRVNAFSRLMSLPGAAPLSCSSSEAVDYLKEDAGQVEDAISWTLDVLGSAVFTITALVTLVSIDPFVTLLAFAPLVLVVALAQLAEGRVSRYRESARKAQEEATGAMGDCFAAVQAIKAAGAEEGALARLSELCETRRRAALKDGLFSQLLDSVYHNTVGVGTGLLLLLVASRAGARGFSLGDFSLFVFCLSFVSDYTCFWGSFLAHFQRTRVSLRRLAALAADESGESLALKRPLTLRGKARRGFAAGVAAPNVAAPRHQATAHNSPHNVPNLGGADGGSAPREGPDGDTPDGFRRLSVEGLSCLHPSGSGVRDISFELSRGEFLVVTGRIGSGKTTLLRAVQGLLPAEGRILVDGRTVEDPASFFTPPFSAYTPQAPVLFSDSLEENLRLGLDAKEEDIRAALLSAALERDLEVLPEGLATRIGPRGHKLSGGQAQRSAAARMFLRRPSVLFIDDMSSALDSETEEILWERFFASGQGTCVAVSHRRATIARADRVLVLKDGGLEAIGSLAEVLAHSEEMRRLWG